MTTEFSYTKRYEGNVEITVLDCTAILAEINARERVPPPLKIKIDLSECPDSVYQTYGDILSKLDTTQQMMISCNKSCCNNQWTLSDLMTRVKVDKMVLASCEEFQVSPEYAVVMAVLMHEDDRFPTDTPKGLFKESTDLLLDLSNEAIRFIQMLSTEEKFLYSVLFDVTSCTCPESPPVMVVEDSMEAIAVSAWPHSRVTDPEKELQFAPSYRVGEVDLSVSHKNLKSNPLHENKFVSQYVHLVEVLQITENIETVICLGTMQPSGVYAAAASFPHKRFYLSDTSVSFSGQSDLPVNCAWFTDISQVHYDPATTFLFDDTHHKLGRSKYEMANAIEARSFSVKFCPPVTVDTEIAIIGSRIDTLSYQSTGSPMCREVFDRGDEWNPLSFYPIKVPTYYDFMTHYNTNVRDSYSPVLSRITNCKCSDCFSYLQCVRIASSMTSSSEAHMNQFVKYLNKLQNGSLYNLMPDTVRDHDCMGNYVSSEPVLDPVAFVGGTVRLLNRAGVVDVYCPPYVYTPLSETFMIKHNGFRVTYEVNPKRPYVFGNGIGSIPIGLYYHVRTVLGTAPSIIDDGGYRVCSIGNSIPHDPGPETFAMF